jgi:acetyl esterase/lipase
MKGSSRARPGPPPREYRLAPEFGDPYRDEAVAYATQIWAGGGVAELHVWPGGFHGFEPMAPHSRLAQVSRQVRNDWLERLLSS